MYIYIYIYIYLSKLVNLLTSALSSYSLHIVILGLPLVSPSPLVALLSPLILKLLTYFFIILLLFCETVCRLIYNTLLITSLLHLY